MSGLDLYRMAVKPAIYKGISMRSTLEAKTAAALERVGLRLGVDFNYEPLRFADDEAFYTPDFRIDWIPLEGSDKFTGSEVFVEARPEMVSDGFRKKAAQNATTLAHSTDSPLLFVGLNEMPAALLGWCYSTEQSAPWDPVLAVIGTRRNVRFDGNDGLPEPCLYVGAAANIWIDGFMTGSEK